MEEDAAFFPICNDLNLVVLSPKVKGFVEPARGVVPALDPVDRGVGPPHPARIARPVAVTSPGARCTPQALALA